MRLTRDPLALLAGLCLAVTVPAQAAGEPAPSGRAERPVDFARQIQPLLARHCVKCHGADKQESGFRVDRRESLLRGGDAGEPAVVPGRAEEGPLLRRVAGVEPELVMPPEGERLNAEEVGLLRAWIDQGAAMPAPPEDDAETVTDHWSFQPAARRAPPAADDPWVRGPIDIFVRDSLRENGLGPSPEAPREVLIRRVHLDVLGLLPAPEEVEAFAADGSLDAYERLVDRVLASPHYGERWARHWLDAVRFAESNGFETNHERPGAYLYRDWVVQALNGDLPYDHFVFAQLAGDAVGEDAATGFLVAGPTDVVKSPDPVLTAMQRQDELTDIVNTTATAFLGLTVGCARCHSHKFDPIPQTDFYALQAVFAGVRHGERPIAGSDDAERRREAAALAGQIAAIETRLAEFEPEPPAGGTVLIDDEDAERVASLVAKRGHGTNPPGAARGQKDDPGGSGRGPNVSGGRYTWWDNRAGADVLAYRPRAAGRFRVWLSWGCGWHTHSRDARYVLDRDGDARTHGDQTPVATVDQRVFADGTGEPVSQPLWSGFLDAGVHEFSPESALLLRGGGQGEALTADVVVLQETSSDEEATAPAAPRLLPPVNPRRNVERFPPVRARLVRFTVEATNSLEPCLDEVEIWTAGDAPRNVALATAGARVSSSGDYPGNSKHRLEHLHDGRYGNDFSWLSNTPGTGWVQIELAEPVTIDRIEWGRDRTGGYADRLPTRYRVEAAAEDGRWQPVAGSGPRVPFGAGPADSLAYRLGGLPRDAAARAQSLLEEVGALDGRRQALLARPTAYAGQFVSPPPTHRLHRGDPLSPREAVTPGALSVLRKRVGGLELAADADEQRRRVALAGWIVAPENPLTARVIVNRLWQHHFGRGLVATPSDFGAMGARPTHPELLDWLADELVRGGWSLKHVHRLILRSNTYRQSSAPRAEALAGDREAALLWRYPPRRLEAEAIRDNILLVGGTLDRRMGGPGFLMFHPNTNYARNWVPRDEFGPPDFRRMVYALQLRMERDAVFGAFDCPDGGQIAPARGRSTTPIQALSLFNSPFILQQSGLLAERVRREAGAEPGSQARRAFVLTLGRAPDGEETADALALVSEHGLEALCRALLNSNEFLFIP